MFVDLNTFLLKSMNNSLRLAGAILLIAVYSFGISLGTESYTAKEYSQAGDAYNEGYWSAVSNNLSFYFSESEKLIADVRTNFPVTIKTSFSSLLAFVQTSGRVIEAGFSHYCRISGNFLIRYRKADNLFPFQYFW